MKKYGNQTKIIGTDYKTSAYIHNIQISIVTKMLFKKTKILITLNAKYRAGVVFKTGFSKQSA